MDRRIGCHAECERYFAYDAAMKRLREWRYTSWVILELNPQREKAIRKKLK